MKKRILWISGFLLALLFLFGMFGKKAEADTHAQKVDVMFVHDTHSHLNEFPTSEDGKPQVLGGFAKMKTLIEQQKLENPDTLLLDAGDFSMGTLIQVMFEEEASEIRLMGEMGFDATTLGNHEYDYRAKGLANMLNKAVESGEALPPIVLCNVDWEGMKATGFTDEQQLIWNAFERYGVKEYMLVEKNGVRIAITGAFGKDSLDCAPNCPLTFRDPAKAVKETIAKIKEQENADMIVCISHGGTSEREAVSEDEILAKSVPELDLIISGHSHTKLETPIVQGDTYIVSAGEYGKYLGSLSMTQKKDGRWAMDKYELIPVDASVMPDADTQKKIDRFMELADRKYLEQFGYTREQVLCTNEVDFADLSDLFELHTEMNLGSLIADAYTYAVEEFSMSDNNPVDVTVVPSGIVRDTYTKGNLTVENVFNSFSLGIGQDGIPGYPLIGVYLTGKELKTLAEIDASVSVFMPTARLFTDGLCWNYNPHRMLLNRVTDVYLINGKGERVELEDEKLYRVVSDFYSSQMLGSVTDLSFGLLSIVPKFADGTPITNYEDAIIMADGRELKAWVAIAKYMQSFPDTDGDRIGNVPAKYGIKEGRKVAEDSRNLLELLKKPNRFFFMIIGAAVLLLGIVTALVLLFAKLIRKITHRNSDIS